MFHNGMVDERKTFYWFTESLTDKEHNISILYSILTNQTIATILIILGHCVVIAHTNTQPPTHSPKQSETHPLIHYAEDSM